MARLLTEPGAARERLTVGCYLPASSDEPVGAIEQALQATLAADAAQLKLRQLDKSGLLADNPLANVRDMTEAAHAAGALSDEEYALLRKRDALRDIVVRVDDFPFDIMAAEDAPQGGRA